MFRCYIMGHISKPREKAVKIITAKREVTYPNGSKGWEIVKEVLSCQYHSIQVNPTTISGKVN